MIDLNRLNRIIIKLALLRFRRHNHRNPSSRIPDGQQTSRSTARGAQPVRQLL